MLKSKRKFQSTLIFMLEAPLNDIFLLLYCSTDEENLKKKFN